MSITSTQYLCDAWLVEGERFTVDCNSFPEETLFLIDIFSHIVAYNLVTDEEEEGGVDYDLTATEVPTTTKRFVVRKNQLMNNNSSWSTIVKMLVDMSIPAGAHPIMIQKIQTCARRGLCEDNMIIPMVVQIRSRQSMISDPVLVSDSRSVGASKASIDALEKVQAEGGSRQCVICLEDLLVGMEATRMPCLHVYHGSCIRNWLQKNNACPLCRFQMPT